MSLCNVILPALLALSTEYLSHISTCDIQANQREESYKEQIKTLTTKLKQVTPRP